MPLLFTLSNVVKKRQYNWFLSMCTYNPFNLLNYNPLMKTNHNEKQDSNYCKWGNVLCGLLDLSAYVGRIFTLYVEDPLESERFIHMRGTKLMGWMSDLNNYLKNLVIQEHVISFILEVRKHSDKVKIAKGS